ncbi:hypothetical protein LOAG_06672 [Loa loa]|uniref:Uncharacterized protein n=1 Tax=Loa loa TaxID=7209 RepID=A0A1S0TXK2_LOALO|nr:hypothetical protein LOAG_06672 [Loa loa]EFO21816.1 hypothetical protein LOAG_06672 [Loa loa]
MSNWSTNPSNLIISYKLSMIFNLVSHLTQDYLGICKLMNKSTSSGFTGKTLFADTTTLHPNNRLSPPHPTLALQWTESHHNHREARTLSPNAKIKLLSLA